MTCSKGVRNIFSSAYGVNQIMLQAALCKYAHDYVLTPEQLHSLAVNAKKAPCNWLKNGMLTFLILQMILFSDVLKECLVLSVTSVVGDISAPTVPSVIISAKANVGSREVRWS